MDSLKTILHDRELRFDGVSLISPNKVVDYLMLGIHPSKFRVSEITAELELFNKQVPISDTIKTDEQDSVSLDMHWQLNPEYLNIDLDEYIGSCFENMLVNSDYTDDEISIAINRIADELQEIRQRGMVEFIQTVIFILDELRRNSIVWGVGRGSSCASYVLFLLGLHVIDCVKMDISMDEFFHE